MIQDELIKLSSFSGRAFNEIASDFIKQAAIERLLERIINRAIDINQHLIKELAPPAISPPKDYKETFSVLAEMGVYAKEFGQEIGKNVGTRNILIHDYDKIDYSRIYDSIDDCLKDYREYCDYILKFLEEKGK